MTTSLPLIVVSYSHKDLERVTPYLDLLRETYSVWYDDNIYEGTPDWWKAILEQIDRCTIFLPVISANYLQSIYCMAELDYAVQWKKAVFPLIIDSSEAPDNLSTVQSYRVKPNESVETFRKRGLTAVKNLLDFERRGFFDPPKPLPTHPSLPKMISTTKQATPSSKVPLRQRSIEGIYETDVHFLWDDAKLGDAALYFTGKGRPAYLAIKKRKDGKIAGWITVGMIGDFWPTSLAKAIGMSETMVSEQIKAISGKEIKEYMIRRSRLKCLVPSSSFEDALRLFCDPVNAIREGRIQSLIRACPIINENDEPVGTLAYWNLLRVAQDEKLISSEITVNDYMVKTDSEDYVPIYDDVTFKELEEQVDGSGWTSVAVTTKDGRFVGMISRESIKAATDHDLPDEFRNKIDNMKVEPVLRKPGKFTLTPIKLTDPLNDHLGLFVDDRDIDALPVLDNDRLVGLLRYIDILKGVLKLITSESH